MSLREKKEGKRERGRRGRGVKKRQRREKEEEVVEMKPKSRKFSRRFSIPRCLAAEPPRSSRDPFPREYPRMVGTGNPYTDYDAVGVV